MPNDLNELIGRLFSTIPYCVALLVLMILAWIVLRLIRANLSKTELKPADYLETFRKLHEEGELTKEEFRIIKGLLSLQVSRSPDDRKPDYSLLNQHSPTPLTDSHSGKITK